MTAECVRCGAPTPDGAYLDQRCAATVTGWLGEISQLTPDARAVAYGLSSRRGESGGSRKPGSRSPGDDDALDALDAIGNVLTTLAREIAETRGLEIAADGSARPLSASVAGQNGSAYRSATPELTEAS